MQSIKNESKILNKIYSLIYAINSKIDGISGKKIEFIIFALYLMLHVIITLFHEPWYDEAEAWCIAQNGSLKEIIFEVPHLEGHPSLWYLILKVFILFRIDYEPALNICGLVFAGMAVWFLQFRSPFPRLAKLLIPFTYYIFYQYGVIARPYCVIMMVFFWAASVYKDRKLKPWRYTFTLALLCATSAYGLVISGGLAIAWVIELIKSNKFLELIKSKYFYCLLALLLYALFVIYRIIPENSSDIMVNAENIKNGLAIRLIYSFFVILPDIFFTNIFSEYGHLNEVVFDYTSFFAVAILGVLILIGFILLGRKKNTLFELLLPYCFFSLFGGVVYLCIHHIGIMLCFIVFWIWISMDKGKTESVELEVDLKKHITVVVSAVCIIISLLWSILTCGFEITDNYSCAKRICQFLDENQLNDSNVIFEWKGDKERFKYSSLEVAFLPYKTEENILNWPVEKPLFPFYLAIESEKFTLDTLGIISKGPLPDVIVGDVDLLSIYGDRIIGKKYSQAEKIDFTYTWKGTKNSYFTHIYVGDDVIALKNKGKEHD